MALEIVPSRVAARIGELPQKALEMARLCDGARTLEALCTDSGLPKETVTPIVERLLALGVVRESAQGKRRPLGDKALAWANGTSLPFSDDEEQFFARPVAAEE